jgi:glucose-6-phosphate-specific signal transduction histidine kinase
MFTRVCLLFVASPTIIIDVLVILYHFGWVSAVVLTLFHDIVLIVSAHYFRLNSFSLSCLRLSRALI